MKGPPLDSRRHRKSSIARRRRGARRSPPAASRIPDERRPEPERPRSSSMTLTLAQPSCPGAFDERILPPAAFDVVDHLIDRRLADIDDRLAGEMVSSDPAHLAPPCGSASKARSTTPPSEAFSESPPSPGDDSASPNSDKPSARRCSKPISLSRPGTRRAILCARFVTRQAKDEVIDWLRFYNHGRLHSTLGYLTPMAFEKKWLGDDKRVAA